MCSIALSYQLVQSNAIMSLMIMYQERKNQWNE